MINKLPPLRGFDIRIPIIIPIKGKGFINHGSTLGRRCKMTFVDLLSRFVKAMCWAFFARGLRVGCHLVWK